MGGWKQVAIEADNYQEDDDMGEQQMTEKKEDTRDPVLGGTVDRLHRALRDRIETFFYSARADDKAKRMKLPPLVREALDNAHDALSAYYAAYERWNESGKQEGVK